MANALKCDRCGKFYIKNEKHKTSGRVNGGILGGITTVSTNENHDKWLDLCDDCISDLLDFLDGKELMS